MYFYFCGVYKITNGVNFRQIGPMYFQLTLWHQGFKGRNNDNFYDILVTIPDF